MRCLLLLACSGCSLLFDAGTLGGDAGRDVATTMDAPVETSTMDASQDARDAATNVWIDTFDRTDDPLIGNGWILKQSPAFRLVSNRVDAKSVNTGYRDNIVYRPPTEDALDVVVSIEFALTQAPGYPQVFARVQQATVQNPDTIDGYIFFVANQPNSAILGRQKGNMYLTTLATLAISPVVDAMHVHRLRLTVKGTFPVQLTGEIEQFDANAKKWVLVANAVVQDTSTERIDKAGSVGFSESNMEAPFTYDNFTRTTL